MSAKSRAQRNSRRFHRILFGVVTVLVAFGIAQLVLSVSLTSFTLKRVSPSVLYFGPLTVGIACYAIANFWFARRIVAAGVSDLEYVKGTTTLRAIAAALATWLAFSLTWATLSLYLPYGLKIYDKATWDQLYSLASPIITAVQSLLGLAAIVAVAAPAYTEYRTAIDSAKP